MRSIFIFKLLRPLKFDKLTERVKRRLDPKHDPKHAPATLMKCPVHTRTQGVVGAAGEKPVLTRFSYLLKASCFTNFHNTGPVIANSVFYGKGPVSFRRFPG